MSFWTQPAVADGVDAAVQDHEPFGRQPPIDRRR
jgi:hypothetical protein